MLHIFQLPPKLQSIELESWKGELRLDILHTFNKKDHDSWHVIGQNAISLWLLTTSHPTSDVVKYI